MHRRLLAAALTLAVVIPASLFAITYGYVDTNGTYSNTGAFIVKSPTTGQLFPICSGTLIAPDVFLTASHCTAFFEQDLAPGLYLVNLQVGEQRYTERLVIQR